MNFKFSPRVIQLHGGTRITLRLFNQASGGHSFSAPAFFASAHLDPQSAALVRDGEVEVPAHRAVDITLVPSRGTYPLKCSHTLHALFGMRGTIVVD